MVLTDAQLNDYLANLEPNQAESVKILRALILECDPTLSEAVDTGKWFGGLLVYTSPKNTFLLALGPRTGGKTTLHMMAYYSSPAFHARHGESLKKFLTGKSCLMCRHANDLPLDAIRDIVTTGGAYVEQFMQQREAAQAKKKTKA